MKDKLLKKRNHIRILIYFIVLLLLNNNLACNFIPEKLLVKNILSGMNISAMANESEKKNEDLPDEVNTDLSKEIIEEIINYKLIETRSENIQSWIDNSLSDNAGNGQEWYIIALSHMGKYDFGTFNKALSKYLSENEEYSAVSRQKYALTLIATRSDSQYIVSALNDSIGKQGVMSFVFGLHLISNNYVSNEYSLDEVKNEILSLQLEDGGWSVMGTNSDVDVTAMTIQALAPYYTSDTLVKKSVDEAIDLLGKRQLSSGDYSSYGVENAESTAQVIVALSALGIDCQNDKRFIKNGNTLFDGLNKYRLDDGSFSHKDDGKYNEMATVQVLCAMVSYLRMNESKTPLYIWDEEEEIKNNLNNAGIIVSNGTNNKSDLENVTKSDKNSDDIWGNYKIWVSFIIIAVMTMICIILFLLKKRNRKNFFSILILMFIMLIFVWMTDFQSKEDYYDNGDIIKENAIGSVTLTVSCDLIADKKENEFVPENGIIIPTEEYLIEKGDTVYDILKEGVIRHKIHMEITGSERSIYVEGINHIYEFEYGDLAGWMYYVNGESVSSSCSAYEVSDGDSIEFVYSLEMGKDIIK